jgi:hypothetical protein
MGSKLPAEPPGPPSFRRRIAIAPLQWIGVGLLALIVAVALSGVLGLKSAEASASADGVQLLVRYPSVMRHKTSLPLEVSVTNTGSAPLADMVLQVDRAYLSRFADVKLTPDASQVTERDFEVGMGALPAGQSRRIVTRLEASERGRHDGRVQLAAGGRTLAAVTLSTMVLP